jgi:hypothetical protein
VSDTPQGQDWWQASDGKWYAPQGDQQLPPPGTFSGGPQAGYPPPDWVAPASSGLAIASLVLSILWLGGLGSLIAVIFGIVALSQINHSQGRKSGSGLAIAGLVIGGIGVLGSAAVFAVVIPAASNNATSAADDTLAQADLRTSLTAAKIFYTENSGSYAGVDSPGPISNIGDMGTGFTFSQGTTSTGANDISLVEGGGGTWLILAAYAPELNNCWFLVDLTAPSTQTLAGLPTGSRPGTYYGVVTGSSAMTCLAASNLQPSSQPSRDGFPSG